MRGAAFVGVLALAACERAPEPAPPPPIELAGDLASQLAADPERLKAAREGCRTDAPGATETLCAAAAEATRRRFRGEAGSYRPAPVDPFPAAEPGKAP